MARTIVDQTLPDVVYNEDTKLWACCGIDSSGNVKCPNPSDETFNAPSPEDIQSYYLAGSGAIGASSPTSTSSMSSTTSATSTSATSSTSSATSSTAASSASASPTPAASSGLSSGAKAGIGVGVALGVLGVLFIVFAIFSRQRRKQRRIGSQNGGDGDPYPPAQQMQLAEHPQQNMPLQGGWRGHPDAKHELPANENGTGTTQTPTGVWSDSGRGSTWKGSSTASDSGVGTMNSNTGTMFSGAHTWQSSQPSEGNYSELPEQRGYRNVVEMDAQQGPRSPGR
ncbi:MAG: hypothetical protein Q9227_001132 [Pyrenula ochraceoflavens]